MKLRSKLLLALLATVSYSYIVIAETREDDQEYESRRRKVCRCCSLIVTGNGSFGGGLTVSGSETVTGSVTAGSFIVSPLAASLVTGAGPGVPGIGGALAWGEVGNTAGTVAVGAGTFFPMNYASASFSGMTEAATSTPATDGLTLTNAGVYFFFYQATQALGTVATIRLTSTGTPIPNSQVTSLPGAANVSETTGFMISVQPALALIQLQNSGATGITTPATNIVGAKLVAIRIA